MLAHNLSSASENRIHDDAVAQRFGFRGALVPGVDVYGYMAHLAVERWGIDWLERGTGEGRFLKPVYEGDTVIARAAENGTGLKIAVESAGVECATGAAALPSAYASPPSMDAAPIPSQDERPDAHETTLYVGRRLSSRPLQITRELLERYLRDIGETEKLYARESIIHPAFVLRLCNLALKDNVKLAAWIHAASAVRHFGLARADSTLTAHARVVSNYERKGHRYAELDVVVASDERAIAQVHHTAIYRLREAQQEKR